MRWNVRRALRSFSFFSDVDLGALSWAGFGGTEILASSKARKRR